MAGTEFKTSAIMSMLEQMVETRVWKEVRGLTEKKSVPIVYNNERQCNIFWLNANC